MKKRKSEMNLTYLLTSFLCKQVQSINLIFFVVSLLLESKKMSKIIRLRLGYINFVSKLNVRLSLELNFKT